MVAYSFKRRFVEPIRWGLGLGLDLSDNTAKIGAPKRQTIRADRKRHARPGEELQLYSGMRTKGCFLIGRARCVGVESIRLRFGRRTDVVIGKIPLNPTDKNLDAFAREDGFENWNALRDFWNEEHGVERFEGVIVYWEPLS